MVNPIVLHNWTKLSKSGQTLVNWQKKSKFTQYEASLDKLAKKQPNITNIARGTTDPEIDSVP